MIDKDIAIQRVECEFSSPQLERTFLQSKLDQDKIVAQFFCLVLALVTLLISCFDNMIVQAAFWPLPALFLRSLMIAVCIICAVYTTYIEDLQKFKHFVIFFMLFLATNVQSMAYIFDSNYVFHLSFDVIILVSFYFSTLLSFKLSTLLGVTYSLLALSVVFWTKEVSTHTFYMIVFAHVAANAVGMVMSAHQHLMRRGIFVRNRQLSNLAQEMQNQAFKDALTQLPNRRAFENSYSDYQRITEQQVCKKKKVCVALADIDFFKQINDTYGHEVGDIVLEQFSALLKASLRDYDDVYRFGGEEFVIILPFCSISDAEQIIGDLIFKLNANKFVIGNLQLTVKASFGLTVMRGEQRKSVIARADSALYQAKRQGRNQMVVRI